MPRTATRTGRADDQLRRLMLSKSSDTDTGMPGGTTGPGQFGVDRSGRQIRSVNSGPVERRRPQAPEAERPIPFHWRGTHLTPVMRSATTSLVPRSNHARTSTRTVKSQHRASPGPPAPPIVTRMRRRDEGHAVAFRASGSGWCRPTGAVRSRLAGPRPCSLRAALSPVSV